MPDKEVKEKIEVIEPQSEPKSVKTEKVTKNPDGEISNRPTSKRWIVWLVIGCVLIAIGLAALAAMLMGNARERAMMRQDGPNIQVTERRGFGGGGYHSATYYSQSSESDGLTTTTTTTKYTYTQGVVKSVSGDSIVVVGNGKEQTIKTNGDTTYDNDTKPKANDTVAIVGTADNSTITATRVSVANY